MSRRIFTGLVVGTISRAETMVSIIHLLKPVGSGGWNVPCERAGRRL